MVQPILYEADVATLLVTADEVVAEWHWAVGSSCNYLHPDTAAAAADDDDDDDDDDDNALMSCLHSQAQLHAPTHIVMCGYNVCMNTDGISRKF